MSDEIREVEEFPGYGVSRDGRVWTRKNARWGLRDTWKPMTPRPTLGGYGMIGLCRDGKAHPKIIHRLIYETFHGLIPPGMDINHINGIKLDNRDENLEVVTRAGNMEHASKMGLLPIAERNHATILSRDGVQQIRELSAHGLSQREIGTLVGCCRANVGLILQGKTWKHLEADHG